MPTFTFKWEPGLKRDKWRSVVALPRPRRKFVFCIASDANFGRHLTAGIQGRVYRYGLGRADRIIAQTNHQKRGLLNAMGSTAEVIPMAPVLPFRQSASAPNGALTRVLWVGRITPEKRLEWLLEAARRCPQATFYVVGTPNKSSNYASTILAEAALLPNVRVHGRASSEELTALYRQCALVCCTSVVEGFPTTFLEAWSCGIPVVTTFDPDGVVALHGLGLVGADVDSLVSHITTILGNPSCRSVLSASAKSYYLEHHALETVPAASA